jgi:protein-cysteine N-palmitoyltransferase HHAT
MALDRVQDLSDFQWREWRDKKFILLYTMGPFLLISFLMRTLAAKRGWKPAVQVWFYAVVGLLGCWVMHGSGTIWILTILFGNYIIGRLLEPVPENVAVFLIWVYNAGALTLNHLSFFESIGFFFPALGFLDQYRGLMPWHIYFKMVMLRLVSYAIDYQIAYRQKILKRDEHLEVDSQAKQTRRERQETADLNLFGVVPLVAYALYLPLYLAGPIATFSSFARSCELRQKTVPISEILIMIFKVAIYWIGLDIFLHYIYVYSWNVIGDWDQYTPGMLSLICYWTLNFMFMKLMIIWRTFRAIALLDGIYTVRYSFFFFFFETLHNFFRSFSSQAE